ncbi:DUF1684 domain-containing protein [Arthrobacter sp. fls2-241-R2A-200]|uniref:DUF1684 domain-containing protein n=1 Tax=Arthrobacter sp. fls2-241-R2A-200 TaxID=3040281 RepID=UPI00254A07AC|nr:DUF1684 domain-containing protein [Arthrobacter sp. fls2-241-R2A-200]
MSLHTNSATHAATTLEAFDEEWLEWHAAHERNRAHPHGFLAVTHLHWLSSEATRLEGAPGTWSADDDVVRVVLEPGESLLQDGVELNSDAGKSLELGPIEERGGINLVSGDTVIEVAKRGGEYIVRPRNPENQLLKQYQGTPAYTPNAAFAVAGRFVPFETPRATTVGAAVEGIQHVYEAPGEIRFKLAGKELALTAFNGYAPGSLSVLFTDQTSGKTTYAANRSLSVVPAADGTVQLDFNRAVNLPCAYTDLATCPLPPAENRLPVAIEAGEKIPYERQDQK